MSGAWIANTNLNILPNGRIVIAWENKVTLLDGDTGLILKQNALPTGPTPIADATYKHLTIAPDGTVILKDQTRPTGCTLQGTMAIIKCVQEGMEQGASSILAVHQKDAAKLMKTIFPFGPLKPGEWSWAPPKPQTDPENSMIYSADMGVGKVAGINLDQATGEMKTVWMVDDTTTAYAEALAAVGQVAVAGGRRVYHRARH